MLLYGGSWLCDQCFFFFFWCIEGWVASLSSYWSFTRVYLPGREWAWQQDPCKHDGSRHDGRRWLSLVLKHDDGDCKGNGESRLIVHWITARLSDWNDWCWNQFMSVQKGGVMVMLLMVKNWIFGSYPSRSNMRYAIDSRARRMACKSLFSMLAQRCDWLYRIENKSKCSRSEKKEKKKS